MTAVVLAGSGRIPSSSHALLGLERNLCEDCDPLMRRDFPDRGSSEIETALVPGSKILDRDCLYPRHTGRTTSATTHGRKKRHA